MMISGSSRLKIAELLNIDFHQFFQFESMD